MITLNAQYISTRVNQCPQNHQGAMRGVEKIRCVLCEKRNRIGKLDGRRQRGFLATGGCTRHCYMSVKYIILEVKVFHETTKSMKQLRLKIHSESKKTIELSEISILIFIQVYNQNNKIRLYASKNNSRSFFKQVQQINIFPYVFL